MFTEKEVDLFEIQRGNLKLSDYIEKHERPLTIPRGIDAIKALKAEREVKWGYEQISKNGQVYRSMNITNDFEPFETSLPTDFQRLTDDELKAKRKTNGLNELDDEPIYGKIQDVVETGQLLDDFKAGIMLSTNRYENLMKMQVSYNSLVMFQQSIWYKLYKFFN